SAQDGLPDRIALEIEESAKGGVDEAQGVMGIHHHDSFLHTGEDGLEIEGFVVNLAVQLLLLLGDFFEGIGQARKTAAMAKNDSLGLSSAGQLVEQLLEMPPVQGEAPPAPPRTQCEHPC